MAEKINELKKAIIEQALQKEVKSMERGANNAKNDAIKKAYQETATQINNLLHKLSGMSSIGLLLALLVLPACAAENCFKVDGAGINLAIGCDETTMQPVTRRETLEQLDK